MSIGESWGSVRSILKEHFTFSDIKDLVGAAGLPVHKLARVAQGLTGYSKGQLLDEIDRLVLQLDEPHQDRFVTACVEGVLTRNAHTKEPMEQVLARVGYGLNDKTVFPLQLQIDLETTRLDQNVSSAMTKSLKRYRDGDFDGAITAMCGAVDSLTEQIYLEKSFGDHKSVSYHERVSPSFRPRKRLHRRSKEQKNDR